METMQLRKSVNDMERITQKLQKLKDKPDPVMELLSKVEKEKNQFLESGRKSSSNQTFGGDKCENGKESYGN